MTQATATLRQGQALLRRNQADQSLPLLESALKQFDNTGDQVGAAAAHDALGDVYIRQGQYELALPHYQAAADAYRTWKETGSANLMFAKLGETYYLAGRTDDAQKAFAQISQQGKNNPNGGRGSGGDGSSNGRDGQNSGGTSGTVTFAAVSAALLPGLTCDALGAPRRPDQPALPGSSGGAKASEPPNMGHAPQGADGIGRMDLRVTDEQGNPVSGVEARLSTQRTNGFLCDCMNHTDVTGRALMNPIHIGPQLKLQLKAKGYPAQEINVQPGAIAEPYRVVLHRVGSATVLPPGATPPAAAAAQAGSNASTQPSSPRACFDLYALFIGYVTAELGLGRIDFERNDLAAAQTHFENILAATDGNAPTASLLAARLYRAVARTSLGDIALKQGHYAAAAKLYEQAARIAATDNRPELAWAAARGIGRSSWLQANEARDPQSALALRNEARAAYRTALDRIETLFAGSLRADDARTSFLARTKDVFDEAAMVSAEMSLTTATQGRSAQGQPTFAHAPDSAGPLSGPALAYAVEAFRIAEEGRARSLLDLLSEAHADITAGVPAELLQRRADNLARQQELADLLTGVGANSGAPDNTVTKLEAELERLSLEAQSLENQIRVASPRYNTLVRTQPLTLAEVQTQVLDNDTVLLEYSLGNESSYLWVVTKNNGLALYRLPARANIEAQVERVRAELVPTGQRRSIVDLTGDSQRGLALGGAPPPQNVQAYADAAYALYRSVVAPAASMSANKRLLVVADGALNYVPFEALVTQPTGADFASLPYLVQTNEIIYAPSASVVAALRQQARGSGAQGPPHLLLVADPIFDANDARVKGGAGDENGAARGAEFRGLALGSAVADVTHTKPAKVRLTRLTGTRMEAQQIAQLARSAGAGADVWLDSEASEDNVERRDLSRYRMLHFATHGLLDAERPQFTGLALAPAGADAADGFLRVGEVFNLRLGSPLVILSACETGLGREKRGEGVIGLTRAFMYAGAPTVGVSLWSVADKSTAELMPDFYQRLLKEPTTSAPAALRAAQQQMIAGGRYSAPFYWAPFIIAGDWK
jgi:CHAT domain-containing protein